MHFVGLYAFFAALSIALNLLIQDIVLRSYPGRFRLLLAMVLGTLAGLALKYILDKVWIFRYKHRDAAHNLRTFIAYSAMGTATTSIFWLCEYTAVMIQDSSVSRNAGALVGLIIGYYVKYRLDKRYVFVDSAQPSHSH